MSILQIMYYYEGKWIILNGNKCLGTCLRAFPSIYIHTNFWNTSEWVNINKYLKNIYTNKENNFYYKKINNFI